MSKWYNFQGNNSDVVLSSKIRLARNVSDAPFPSRMSNEIRKSVCKKIFAAIKNSNQAGEFDLIEMQSVNDLKKIAMAESNQSGICKAERLWLASCIKGRSGVNNAL